MRDNGKKNVRYITKLEQLDKLSAEQVAQLAEVTDKFAFRVNDYYLSLIDFNDPADPIRRMVIPDIQELYDWGRLDPSSEQTYTIMPGLEHKYNSTALLLVNNVCDGICRYCFRKRVFINPSAECLEDIDGAMDYIKSHSQITNVLLTGGDPLVLLTAGLEKIITRLRAVEHVKIIRIGTKIPVFNPYRIIDDPALPELIKRYSLPDRKIYIMTHFTHPREFTDIALKAISLLQSSGAVLANQCPLIRGVNDNPEVLAELLARASFTGVVPYYIFQCRPAIGNRPYTVPIEEGYNIIELAKKRVSGLAKRCKFVMSHSSGKIEIVGRTKSRVYFKYHRAADDADSGRFIVFRSNPSACWFDDYQEAVKDYSVSMPYRAYGPE